MLVYVDFCLLSMLIALAVSGIALYKEQSANYILLFVMLLYLVTFDIFFTFFPSVINPFGRIKANNLSMHIELVFYLLILYAILQTKKYKALVISTLVAFVLFSIVNALVLQPLDAAYSNFSFVFGSLGVLLSILFYFKEQLQGDGFRRVFHNFWFWFAAALFVFLATEIPIMSILNYLLHTHQNAAAALPIMKLKLIVSSLYYLSVSIAFIVCQTKA